MRPKISHCAQRAKLRSLELDRVGFEQILERLCIFLSAGSKGICFIKLVFDRKLSFACGPRISVSSSWDISQKHVFAKNAGRQWSGSIKKWWFELFCGKKTSANDKYPVLYTVGF